MYSLKLLWEALATNRTFKWPGVEPHVTPHLRARVERLAALITNLRGRLCMRLLVNLKPRSRSQKGQGRRYLQTVVHKSAATDFTFEWFSMGEHVILDALTRVERLATLVAYLTRRVSVRLLVDLKSYVCKL